MVRVLVEVETEGLLLIPDVVVLAGVVVVVGRVVVLGVAGVV